MVYTLNIHVTNTEHKPMEMTIMANGLVEKTKTDQLGSHAGSPPTQHESTCARCGGLMVKDFCMDLLNSTGELEIVARRCVQCGEVVDSVILLNRYHKQQSTMF